MLQHFRELSGRRRIRQILTIFFCLQVLDMVSTLLGLRLGASESSVFVSRLLQFGPVTGLLLSKVVACALALAAVFCQRERLVRFVNFWFVGVVGWNVVIIGLASTRI